MTIRQDTQGFPWHKAAFAAAAAAGVVAAVIAVLTGIFYVQAGQADPQTAPHLAQLRQQLSQARQDEGLKDQIRQEALALRLRQAHLRQNMLVGLWMLLGFSGLAVVALQVGWTLKKETPAPDASGEPAVRQERSANLARYTMIGSAGLLLACAVLLTLAMPSYKPLEMPGGTIATSGPATLPAEKIATTTSTPQPQPYPSPQPQPALVKTVEGVDYATTEEMQKNWPMFRGPGGLAAARGEYPITFNAKEKQSLLWQVAVPLEGKSSPLVWQGKVFLTGASRTTQELYCFDAKTGKLLWTGKQPPSRRVPKRSEEAAAHEEAKLEEESPAREEIKLNDDTGLAPNTPATDGRHVFAVYPTGDLVAFDLDGKKLWSKLLDIGNNPYGYASSLAVWRDLVIVQLDTDDETKSALYGIQGATGAQAFKTIRPISGSWASPIVANTPTGPQIIAVGDPYLMGYRAQDGKEMWRAEKISNDVTPSPAYADGMAFACQSGSGLLAIKTDGKGDVSKTHLAWQGEENLPDIVSPLADGQYVYTLTSGGTFTAFAAKDGKKAYEKELDMQFNASPVLADQRLYLLGLNGKMLVVASGGEYQEVGHGEVEGPCHATPALAEGRIYIRGKDCLYCISEEK
jgi:outer membrane protein assembly factor BamB